MGEQSHLGAAVAAWGVPCIFHGMFVFPSMAALFCAGNIGPLRLFLGDLLQLYYGSLRSGMHITDMRARAKLTSQW